MENLKQSIIVHMGLVLINIMSYNSLLTHMKKSFNNCLMKPLKMLVNEEAEENMIVFHIFLIIQDQNMFNVLFEELDINFIGQYFHK